MKRHVSEIKGHVQICSKSTKRDMGTCLASRHGVASWRRVMGSGTKDMDAKSSAMTTCTALSKRPTWHSKTYKTGRKMAE